MWRAIIVIVISLASAGSAQARYQLSPEAQALIDRAEQAAKNDSNYDPVVSRLFYRAAQMDQEMSQRERDEIVATVEEALANKAGVSHFRALTALYYPKDDGFVVCGWGRYYSGGKEINGAFIYTDMYGGIRMVQATENARRAYDCQSIANFRLR